MKIKSLIAFVLLLTLIVSDEFNPNYNYDDFYRQFGRTYQGEEKRQHEQIFNQNYAKLKQRILNGENVTVDKFLDWNQTQLDAFFPPRPQNSAKSSPNSLSRGLRLLRLGYFTIPPTFDWRDYGKVTSVKDQGGCGSCWTFSATGQYESAIAIATNGSLFDLSEEYVGECTYTSGGGCSGGHQYSALNMVNRTSGIPLQEQYPYQGQSNYYRDRGINICSQPNKTVIPVKIQQIINIGLNTTEQIQQQLLANGPMSIGVHAGGWVNQGSGYYSCTNPGGINHGVLLVGYTQTHWIVKNSWGEGWGVQGYFYLPKNSSTNCRLNQDLIILHIDYGFNPTPLPPSPNPPPAPPAGSIVYNVSMTDSYGDGWEGTILGIRQNGLVVATFGNDFTSGSSKKGNITISDKIYAYIVVVKRGNYTSQVGFVITLFGTQVFRRVNGASFPADIIFYKFCPSTQCEQPPTVTYYLTLYDSWGDGWNGNTLAFNQSGVIQTFTLPTGRQSSTPIAFTFKKYDQVIVYVHIIGTWTYECGYVLKTFDGLVVNQRTAGQNSFSATSILSRFTPENVNYLMSLSAIKVRGQLEDKQETSKTEIAPDQKIDTPNNTSFKTATFVLAPLLIVVFGVAIFAFFKAWQYGKELGQLRSLNRNDPQSAKTISVEMN